MTAPDEPAVETEAPAPSIAERLARFLLHESTEAAKRHELPVVGELDTPWEYVPEAVREAQLEVAETVLRDFFRVDVDATSIYAVPGVDVETLAGFAMVHWGPMAGRLDPAELRALGGVFIEIAEAADLDSAMMRWLLRDPGADRAGAAKILGSFRQFRAELDVAEEPLEPGPAE
jgi:hypothetical protein